MSIDLPGTPNSLRSTAVDQAARLRPVLARHIDRLLLEAERPLVSRGPRTLVRPAVATAARPSLVAISAMLRDERRHVAPDAVEAVRAFLQDGADSRAVRPRSGAPPPSPRRPSRCRSAVRRPAAAASCACPSPSEPRRPRGRRRAAARRRCITARAAGSGVHMRDRTGATSTSAPRVVTPPEPHPRSEAAVRTAAMTIPVARAIGHGPTELAAFDAALVAAGVADRNLIPLSSVLPPDSEVLPVERIERAPGEWGDRLYCVLAEARASRPGDEAWAAIGWVHDEAGRGLLVEHTAADEASVRLLVGASLHALCVNRGTSFAFRGIEVAGARCQGAPVCALVIAVFAAGGWRRAGAHLPVGDEHLGRVA